MRTKPRKDIPHSMLYSELQRSASAAPSYSRVRRFSRLVARHLLRERGFPESLGGASIASARIIASVAPRVFCKRRTPRARHGGCFPPRHPAAAAPVTRSACVSGGLDDFGIPLRGVSDKSRYCGVASAARLDIATALAFPPVHALTDSQLFGFRRSGCYFGAESFSESWQRVYPQANDA